jgi:hypothetical protein
MLRYIAIDQYGIVYKLSTKFPRKELLEYFGTNKADKMYVDTKTGVKHIGYVILKHWLTIYSVSLINS